MKTQTDGHTEQTFLRKLKKRLDLKIWKNSQ